MVLFGNFPQKIYFFCENIKNHPKEKKKYFFCIGGLIFAKQRKYIFAALLQELK